MTEYPSSLITSSCPPRLLPGTARGRYWRWPETFGDEITRLPLVVLMVRCPVSIQLCRPALLTGLAARPRRPTEVTLEATGHTAAKNARRCFVREIPAWVRSPAQSMMVPNSRGSPRERTRRRPITTSRDSLGVSWPRGSSLRSAVHHRDSPLYQLSAPRPESTTEMRIQSIHLRASATGTATFDKV